MNMFQFIWMTYFVLEIIYNDENCFRKTSGLLFSIVSFHIYRSNSWYTCNVIFTCTHYFHYSFGE